MRTLCHMFLGNTGRSLCVCITMRTFQNVFGNLSQTSTKMPIKTQDSTFLTLSHILDLQLMQYLQVENPKRGPGDKILSIGQTEMREELLLQLSKRGSCRPLQEVKCIDWMLDVGEAAYGVKLGLE